MATGKNVHLIVIDPQNDFCDACGALFVGGADDDMRRLADFINKGIRYLNDIHITLDSHRLFDVAHPIAWVDENGANPAPFTVISANDVKSGKFRASHPSLQTKWMDYVEALEKNGRYPLCIWPAHCLIGSWGHNVDPGVLQATHVWEESRVGNMVDFVTKGSNPFTEHYSAVAADVPDPADPSTQLNTRLIDTIQNADEILIAGEALSHCVANTIRDIANNFGEDNISKFILLEDCTSSVAGFEALGTAFVDEMKLRGMKTAKAVDFF